METPLERAHAKCEEIERELRKSPDFQLYLITTSRKDRARMERLLNEMPEFWLWRTLKRAIERSTRKSFAPKAVQNRSRTARSTT